MSVTDEEESVWFATTRGKPFGRSTLDTGNLTPDIQTAGIVLKRQGQVDLRKKNNNNHEDIVRIQETLIIKK